MTKKEYMQAILSGLPTHALAHFNNISSVLNETKVINGVIKTLAIGTNEAAAMLTTSKQTLANVCGVRSTDIETSIPLE